ncbi:MAG TPA: cytochrome c family protein [Gammaproteobacteria bacterium]
MPLHHVVVPLLMLLLCVPAFAANERVVAERADDTPATIPLKEALGEPAFSEAMSSGRYSYAGNLKCRMCHKDFFLGRKGDAHDHAFEKLIEARDAESPRCLGCHSTGYGVKSGFSSVQETPRLLNVQCEGCHGPGSEHIRRLGKGGFLAGPDRPEILSKMCLSCHNARWNRSFTHFDTAYKNYGIATPGTKSSEQ